ncbi:MarR family transcriptional regulator [Georgenia subflava]|uniref:MarR family transcriptional regulator n=1 Tax=Georgenia subflava TaxID=1622177 RepID=A0A6N7EIG1_9MICO|nr:MarR family transcriptional regulator [Georgenia subflava]
MALLEALRSFRRADEEMRRRISRDMDMNITDMQTLQLVIAAERAGEPITPRTIAGRLGISTASTTKLLDRLTLSGHLVRQPHPRDRRSVVVVATPHAHEEVRERLGHMHERMAAVARSVAPECRAAAAAFLQRMADELGRFGAVAPLTPKAPEAGRDDSSAGAPT